MIDFAGGFTQQVHSKENNAEEIYFRDQKQLRKAPIRFHCVWRPLLTEAWTTCTNVTQRYLFEIFHQKTLFFPTQSHTNSPRDCIYLCTVWKQFIHEVTQSINTEAHSEMFSCINIFLQRQPSQNITRPKERALLVKVTQTGYKQSEAASFTNYK